MVYFALLSVVPLLLLVLAMLGLLLRFSDAATPIEQQVLGAIQAGAGVVVRERIESLFAQLERESYLATAVGVAGLLFTASKLFMHLRMTFRAIWNYEPPLVSGTIRARALTTVREHAVAFLMVLVGGLLLLLAMVLLSLTQWIGGLLVNLPIVSHTPAWVVALPGSVAIVFMTFAAALRFLPPVPLQWRHVWVATILCTAAWIIGVELVVLFGQLFRREGPTALGAFGALLVLMLWLNKVSQLLFYGAEVCKVVYSREQKDRRRDDGAT